MECYESCLRNHNYNGPSVTRITSGPDNFEPNIAEYFPVKLLLQYVIIIYY
jgi:hypothetical protein